MPHTYLDTLYDQYEQNPSSVPPEWQSYFAGLQDVADTSVGNGALNSAAAIPGGTETVGVAAMAQNNVSRLIQGYRYHGHRYANVNPLYDPKPLENSQLALAQFELTDAQRKDVFATAGTLPQSHAQLDDILTALRKTYCGSVALQLGDIASLEERRWFREKLEANQSEPGYDVETRQRIYKKLYQADAFEQYLHKKFVGMKRFSVEGGDTLIPMLDRLIDLAAADGMSDMVFGMAHRGRLNVLINIMGKSLTEIFAAFAEKAKLSDNRASGDVKYHAGKSADVTTAHGDIHLSLLSNPSHLEAVNPVVLGSARAKQERHGAEGSKKVLPLLIHGDSAFAGQGVVAETLNLANLKSHTVGGTVHIIINNQVGFTAEPDETFSGEYCSDMARTLQMPVFHVNGDDPEACVYALELAFGYRQQFGKDVLIDLVCYRRYGHNEGDDPTFTQPKMYGILKTHPRPYEIYKKKLLNSGLDGTALEAIQTEYQGQMDNAFTEADKGVTLKPDMFKSSWEGFSQEDKAEAQTTQSAKTLAATAATLEQFPQGFKTHPKVQKVLDQRKSMWDGNEPLNWGAGEMAAYGALLQEGYSVRIVGQDVQRGTFSHRHAMQVDAETGERFAPLSLLGDFKVHNSCLSELAVLGFEFGYSLTSPKTLTIWEAQFGDFANGAQIMIDQFIASTEVKWQRLSGLVMLLPHGFEGQGPEHSSARLERYLQLCGDGNMSVCTPSTPAQICHVLRRQMLRKTRRPLIIMSPKSLLRNPAAVSDVQEIISGGFQSVIGDSAITKAKRVVLCGGKLYYDLVAARDEKKLKDVAIVRIEELYPVPTQQVQDILKQYKAKDVIWAQEEPRNQGAWTFLLDNLFMPNGIDVKCVSRAASASPAVGSPKRHAAEQADVVAGALGL